MVCFYIWIQCYVQIQQCKSVSPFSVGVARQDVVKQITSISIEPGVEAPCLCRVNLRSALASLHLFHGYAADIRDAVTLFFFMQFLVRLWLAPWAPGVLHACRRNMYPYICKLTNGASRLLHGPLTSYCTEHDLLGVDPGCPRVPCTEKEGQARDRATNCRGLRGLLAPHTPLRSCSDCAKRRFAVVRL